MNPARFRWSAAALLCALSCSAHTAPQAVPDTLAQRLLACATCHARVDARGDPVNDSFYPRIGGKPAGYLYHQLRNFQDGRRQYPVMTYLVEHLPDAYLREIAAHFAAQAPAVLAPTSTSTSTNLAPALRERGRQLVHEGDRVRGIPACIACHGARLTGVQPAIPGLLGLPPDYVNAQFGAWRNGARRAHAPDCMGQVAARLTPDDVAAVSGWLAEQPHPDDPRPAATIARPLPLACGSAPEAPR